MSELFQNILTASFHGSIVILAVLALRLVLKKTPKKFLCLLWLLAGIRLLMPFEIRSDLSLQPDREQLTQTIQSEFHEDTRPETPSEMVPAVPEDAAIPEDTEVINGDAFSKPAAEDIPEGLEEFYGKLYEEPSDPQAAAIPDWQALIPCIWLAVACCFGIYSLYSYLHLKRQVVDAVKVPGGWESEHIDTAFILGFIRPRIYIPMGMPKSVRKHILAHERTHLEKGDHWFKMIGFLALALHWFNPLVWVAYILLCKDIEMACDERVVQFMELEERKSYSAALLSCSTNRAHFAACPVAFGEVSVKYRIKSVLNYKKPSFWISLLGVAAIIFVAVCLVTSPEGQEAPVSPETTEAAEPSETVVETDVQSTFAATLTQDDIEEVCTNAIEQLCSQESYLIARETNTLYPERDNRMYTYTSEIRRYGNDMLDLNIEELDNGSIANTSSTLRFGDMYGCHYGDYWVDEGSRSDLLEDDVNQWLQVFSPKNLTVTFPEGTGIISDDSVSFAAEWTSNYSWDYDYSGIITFTFHDDGTVASIQREYQQINSEDSEEIHFTDTLTILEENPQVTYRTIADCAAQCIPFEKVEEYRQDRETITEIPSNKTSYDQDYDSGCVSRQWEFINKLWHVRIGAVDATPTGLTLEYTESGDGHTSFTAEEGFWLEQFIDGKWYMQTDAFEKADLAAQKLNVSWTGTDRYSVDWTGTYGTLGPGYYRIGRYYTVTLSSGETETLPCYAKFQIRAENVEELVSKCQTALADLLARDSYNILVTQNLRNEELGGMLDEDSHYYTTEIWKSRNNYLEENKYFYKSNNALKSYRSYMLKNGSGYTLEFQDNSVFSPMTSWETASYLDVDNFELWSYFIGWSGTDLAEIYEDGNTITAHFTSDFYNDVPTIEYIYTFDASGALASLTHSYIKDTGEKLVDEEMVVFDTSAAEIASVINSIDVTKPCAFSYAEDIAEYPDSHEGVKTSGFSNTSAVTISSTEAAISRALKDCTLPEDAGMNPGTNMNKAFYDEEAKMWKIEFTASWDSTIHQAVYMTDKGITTRTLTLELEVDY